MLDTLSFLLLPVAACVICSAVFGYFGIHVLLRGVIFVDIALAQVAALGSLAGMLAGAGSESPWLALSSIAAVLAAAVIFSTVRPRTREIPQEAVIGIVYCLALALSLFIAEFVPEGSGFIKETLTGALLWVNRGRVILLAVVGAAIGLFHYVFRRRFIELSTDKNNGSGDGSTLWDFLFYFTLGLVIVEAVKVLGVFLVFSLLVAPAAVAMIFLAGWTARFLAAWLIGSLASIAGIFAAYYWNLPNGPSIVTTLGALMIVAAALRALLPGTRKESAGAET